MAMRELRIEILRGLLAADGHALDASDEGIDALNSWFIENTEPAADEPALPSLRWASVTWDVGLFLGDCMIARFPHLRWEFETRGGKSYDGYQSAVVFGFTSGGSRNPSFTVLQTAMDYAIEILDDRAGGFPQGEATVRGISIDLDDIFSRIEPVPVNRREFLTWMQVAARRNNLSPDHPELLSN
ncbi:hypothetical protein CQ044_15515 [Microbacterium sp. MYb64]|nr:hypothetical protein CQ044_15515 [Microbacterium sp. MYb64]